MSAREWGDIWAPINLHDSSEFNFVRGRLVDVAPHLTNATFALIRPQDNPEVTRHHGRGRWRIVNIETGQCIGQADASSGRCCIDKARHYLRDRTVAELEAAYRRHRKHSWALRRERGAK